MKLYSITFYFKLGLLTQIFKSNHKSEAVQGRIDVVGEYYILLYGCLGSVNLFVLYLFKVELNISFFIG